MIGRDKLSQISRGVPGEPGALGAVSVSRSYYVSCIIRSAVCITDISYENIVIIIK